MLESVAVAQWRKKNMINIPSLAYGWGSSTAAVSSTGKVRPQGLLQGHVGKYCGSLLVPAQDSPVPSVNKPKEPKENFPSPRNLVLPSIPLSYAGAHVKNSLMPVSGNISLFLLLLLLGKGLLWSLAPLFHLCDTHVVTQGQEKRSEFCLSLYLSFDSAFLCWK